MLKNLKWDALDFVHRYYLLLIGMFASFLLVIIPIKSNGVLSELLVVLSAGLGFVAFAAGLILAVNVGYRWLVRKSHLLELAVPQPVWQMLLSKIILITLLNLLVCLFILQMSVLWSNNGKFVLLSMQNLKGIPGLVLLLVVIDCTVMFSTIAAMSLRVLRQRPALSTGLLAVVLLTGIITFCAVYMTARGTLILPSISGQNILTVSGSLMIFSTVFPTLFALAVIFVEFLAGSFLLTKYFERDEM